MTGTLPCPTCRYTPVAGEDHARTERAGQADDDVELVCTTADGRPITPITDPWLRLDIPQPDPPF